MLNSLNAQTAFLHTVSQKNTTGHITYLNNSASNNNPKAIVIVAQRGDKVMNPNEVGVWYNQGKWTIYNQNKKALPIGCQFNVLILDPLKITNSFVHTTSNSNIQKHITSLNHSLTNGKAGAQILVTQVYGKYNTSPVGVWYNDGKWKIFNENKSKMPLGTKFNVYVYNTQPGLKGKGNITGGKSFSYKAKSTSTNFRIVGRPSASTTYGMTIDDAGLNGKAKVLIFYTQNYKSKYNPNPNGLKYKDDKWQVVNLNKKPLASGVVFNIKAVNIKNSFVQMQPVFTGSLSNTDIIKPQNNIKKPSPVFTSSVLKEIYKPGQFVIVPDGVKAETGSSNSNATADSAVLSTESQGPNLEIAGMVMLDNIFDENGYDLFLQKLNIGRTVFWDNNKNSNTIYYLPSKYNLNWNKETGEYGFSTFYLSAQNGEAGKVLVNAELNPAIAKEDVVFAEKMLSEHFEKNINLIPMILSAYPDVEFGNELLSLDVDNSSIAITIPEDFLDPIVVTWNMGSRIDDLVALMKEQFGITGKVTFTPFSETEAERQSDIILKLNHEDTYGVFEYSSAAEVLNGIRNSTDYPLILKNFVVLKERSDGSLYIDKLPLSQNRIEPGEYFADWTNTQESTLIAGDAVQKIWLDYELDQDCSSCNEAVDAKILSGTTGPRSHPIEVTLINPLEHTGAYQIKLKIKSIQMDPNGRSAIEKTFNITEDGIEINAGELFYTEDRSPTFEYKIIVIESDGNVKESGWKEHDALYLIIGSALIDNLFSE